MGQPNRRPELGKWLLWRHFHADAKVRPYLPNTAPYRRTTLADFIKKYQVVYVKPVAGFGGRGISKIWTSNRRFYVQRERMPVKSCASMLELSKTIEQSMQGKYHIVQQGILLAHVSGQPFDIRVMMQRDGNGLWKYTGMLAKVAGKGSAITNIARGKGYVLPVPEAIMRSLGYDRIKVQKIMRNIIVMSRQTVRRMEEYQTYSELGLDIAIDQKGKLWLIEENTGPSHPLFAKLPDKSMYNTIQATSRSYWQWRRKNPAQKRPPIIV